MSKINLGENLDILCGFAFSSAYFNSDKNGIPLVRIRDLLKNEIDAYYAGEYEDRYLIKKDDLLIGMDGDFNITTWDREIALLNQRVLRIREKKNSQIDQRFIYFWLIETLHEINRKTSGTTVKHLSTKDVTSLTPDLPDKPEQKAIATVLDTVDEAIQSTQAMLDKQDKIKQGLLHDLLTRGVDERGHLRPSPETAPDLYQQTEIGLIPKGWDATKRLRHLCKRITYGFTNPMPTKADGPWMLTAADIDYGAINYRTARHTSESAFTNTITDKSRPKIGDILITKDGTLGRIAILDKDNVCVNQSVAVVSSPFESVRDYILCYLLSPVGQERILADAGGSTIKHIYITNLSEEIIPLPSENERANIVKISNSLNEEISSTKRHLDKFTSLKSGLMQDLLTGRKRVTPALMRDVEKLAEAA